MAPYDRLIVTCGIAGIPRQWLSQLAPQARIIAPVAHAGVHPILSATRHHSTVGEIYPDNDGRGMGSAANSASWS